MRRELSQADLDFAIENEMPHIQGTTERDIFQQAVQSISADQHGTYSVEQVDKLFDISSENRGTYEEINSMTGQSQPGNLAKGHTLKTFVLRNIRALLREDTTGLAL